MQTFMVSGMTCAHCVRAVTDAVRAVDADASVRVDLEAGRVTVSNATAAGDAIVKAITAEGYTAERLAA